MAGMGNVGTQFTESGFYITRIHVRRNRVQKQAVQDFAVFVVHHLSLRLLQDHFRRGEGDEL